MNRISLVCVLFVSACSTAEYSAERNICASTWMSKILPIYEKEIYMRQESRQVPTGQTTCYDYGYSIQCNQTMRTEYYSVPAVRTVDRNAAIRNSKINACTQNMCIKKYGNTECKPPK